MKNLAVKNLEVFSVIKPEIPQNIGILKRFQLL